MGHTRWVRELLENMDEYTIPARYNPVINHYMAKGDFGYLKFDGRNFVLPIDKLKVFYTDLKEKLPKGELIRKTILKAGSLWGSWKEDIVDDEIFDFTDVKEELTPERMEAIILEEEQLNIPDPEDGPLTWKDVAYVIGVILFVLLILLLIVGLIAASGEIPLPTGGGGGLFSSGGKKRGNDIQPEPGT